MHVRWRAIVGNTELGVSPPILLKAEWARLLAVSHQERLSENADMLKQSICDAKRLKKDLAKQIKDLNLRIAKSKSARVAREGTKKKETSLPAFIS